MIQWTVYIFLSHLPPPTPIPGRGDKKYGQTINNIYDQEARKKRGKREVKWKKVRMLKMHIFPQLCNFQMKQFPLKNKRFDVPKGLKKSLAKKYNSKLFFSSGSSNKAWKKKRQ